MIGALNKQKIKEAFNFSFGKTTSDLIKEKKKSITRNMVFLGAITALDVFLTMFLMKKYGGDVIIFGEHTNTLFFLLNVMTVIVILKMMNDFKKINCLNSNKGNNMSFWSIITVSILSFYIPSTYTPKPSSGCFSSGQYYTVEIGENYKAIVDADKERRNKIIEARLAELNSKEIPPLQSIK